MVEKKPNECAHTLEFEFLFKMLMKMEAAIAAALISREGYIIDQILTDELKKDDLNEMLDLALSASDRIALELNHGLFKGTMGKVLIMDVGKDYVLGILFDPRMDSNEIFSHYWQIIRFIGSTFLDLLSSSEF